MTARVSKLLKSRASLTCFQACFLPGLANNFSTLRYIWCKLPCYNKFKLENDVQWLYENRLNHNLEFV